MNTNELLTKMGDATFGSLFQDEICAIFARDVEAGKYGSEEKEYKTAMKRLQKLLQEDKLALLGEYEALCVQIRQYSARYGFIAGMYCGFKQILTFDQEYDGGFEKYVVEEISLMPKMQRHPQNYANMEKRNAVHEKIIADAPKKVRNAMVPVECYWSQVAHSASMNGFYCGYRAAGAITDRVALTEANYIHRVSKQVTMEHALGYIESFSEKERHQERRKRRRAQLSLRFPVEGGCSYEREKARHQKKGTGCCISLQSPCSAGKRSGSGPSRKPV